MIVWPKDPMFYGMFALVAMIATIGLIIFAWVFNCLFEQKN